MKRRSLVLLVALAGAGACQAQSGTGALWDGFGPDRAKGAFLNITREHLSSQNAVGIAVDRQQRLLVLNEWYESGSTNLDCAVTRHIRNARLLDMDYTGIEELEATRRIAMDMGGANFDLCTSIEADKSNRALITGWGTNSTSSSGFLVRLASDGAYDTSFSSDGKLALNGVAPFAGALSRLNHVYAGSNFILACGSVVRGAHRNLLVARFTNAGVLDTGFSGDGYAEVDFNVAGTHTDSCARLVVLPNGDAIAGGIVTGTDGDQAYGLARFDGDGNFVNSFGTLGRKLIDDGSDIVATPELVDLAYDARNNRLLVGCNLTISGFTSGCLIAVNDNGSLDTSFDGDGRKGFRFSSYGQVLGMPIRDSGETRVKRVLPRDDGSFYVVGTHYNSSGDAANFGASDVVSLRLLASGNVATVGAHVYGNDGVLFHQFNEADQGVDVIAGRRVAETLIDATWYQGNLLLLADRPRYPNNVFDHDNDGNLNEPGPIAPLVAAASAEHLFGADFEFDGLGIPVGGLQPVIAVPFGFGNYCSVRHPTSGSNYGVLAQGVGSDPCQQFLDGNPNLIVERSGRYSISGMNWVIGTCDGNFITLRPGIGTAPVETAFADSAGRSNCIFTVTPEQMPIFSRPYTGAHVAGTQAFNHDVYNIPLDVSEFGQPSATYDACFIDNLGRQRSVGNPNASPSTCDADNSGVNEPAADIPVTESRLVTATAAGRVIMAVPRHVPRFAPAGMDPYQREVFVRHQIGTGRYAETFTTYYAHMQDTAVRRGDSVSAGSVLGQVGTTGSSTGEHLHISVHRHRNLSWRSAWEFGFSGGRHDRDGGVSAIDPWGWRAPQGVDPFAWRFRNPPGDNTLIDNAGSFSTRLWITGEEPPLP